MCLSDTKKTIKIVFDSAKRFEGNRSNFSVIMPTEIQGYSITKPCRVWVESSSLLIKDATDDVGSDIVFLCSNINQYQSLNCSITGGSSDSYSNSQVLIQYPVNFSQGRTATDLYANYQNNSVDTAIYCKGGLPSIINFYLCDREGDRLTVGINSKINLLLCVQFYDN
jgi:hypothetical protein